MKTIVTDIRNGKQMVTQLVDDRVSFAVKHSNPRFVADFAETDVERQMSNAVEITVRPLCSCYPPCDVCQMAAARAMSHADYQLGEALERTSPHNSTDDYD